MLVQMLHYSCIYLLLDLFHIKRQLFLDELLTIILQYCLAPDFMYSLCDPMTMCMVFHLLVSNEFQNRVGKAILRDNF